jgi:hypothetical protein
MSIVTTNPAKVSIRLLDQKDLTHDQIFQLAQHIDAYEIEKKLQESLVIDIHKVTKSGKIDLIITPKTGLTYDELYNHVTKVISFALKSVKLENCRWEILEISFQTEMPGKPSYVYEDLHTAFKAD